MTNTAAINLKFNNPIVTEEDVGNVYRNDFPKLNHNINHDLERSPINGDAFIKEDMPEQLLVSKNITASISPKTVVEGIGFLTAALTGIRKLLEEGKSLKDAIDALFPNSSKEEKAKLMDAISV